MRGGGGGGGGQGGCELRSESFLKIQKKNGGGSGWGGRVWEGGVQGGCEWRSEAFVKIQTKNKKKIGGVWGVGSRRGSDWGCQGRWERRSEACVKIHKKKIGGWGSGGLGWGGGVRVAVNGEVKLL